MMTSFVSVAQVTQWQFHKKKQLSHAADTMWDFAKKPPWGKLPSPLLLVCGLIIQKLFTDSFRQVYNSTHNHLQAARKFTI